MFVIAILIVDPEPDPSGLHGVGGGGFYGWEHGTGAESDPVGLDAFPALNEEAVGFEELADSGTRPSGDFFEDRNQRSEGIIAQDSALGDLGYVFGFGDGDGEPVVAVDVEHDVNIGAAVADVDYVVEGHAEIFGELLEARDLAVSGSGANQAIDFAVGMVLELGAEDLILRHNAFEGGLDDLDGRGREDVEIKMEAVDAAVEDLVDLADIFFQTDALADLDEIVTAHARMELGIVEKQVGEFRSLLNQVQLGHALDLALELFDGNANHFAQDVAGIVKGQRLIEVAGKEVMFSVFANHVLS